MGTPVFAVPVLIALLETQEVVGVVTQPDRPAGRGQELRPSPVKMTAQSAAVPLYQPSSLRKLQSAEPIAAWQPDAIVVAAYGQILRPHLLSLPPRGCLNVHASLLPRWRGAAPIQHAILAGDSETGVSLMQMDEGLDTGPVYLKEAIAITARETAETLHDRLADLGAQMVRQHLDAILAGAIAATPQDEARATYAPLIDKEDGRLNWRQTAEKIDRRVRAMSPWPGAFTTWQRRRLKILDALPRMGREFNGMEPGEVTVRGDDVLVGAALGALQLLEVQIAGKRSMSVVAFVNGYPEFPGSLLDQN